MPALDNFIQKFRRDGLAATLVAVTGRLRIRWFEWRLGIHSEAIVELSALGIENDQCRAYVPTDYQTFGKVLDSLDLRSGKEVFLDFGCGMGRAIIMAAMRGFHKVIGVEIAPQLAETARRNVQNARPRLKCRNIEIVTTDATQFSIPADVTVIYFFNPFCGDILAKVLANIRASLEINPRPLRLVCKVPAESMFEQEIRQAGWLTRERELIFSADSRYLFFKGNA